MEPTPAKQHSHERWLTIHKQSSLMYPSTFHPCTQSMSTNCAGPNPPSPRHLHSASQHGPTPAMPANVVQYAVCPSTSDPGSSVLDLPCTQSPPEIGQSHTQKHSRSRSTRNPASQSLPLSVPARSLFRKPDSLKSTTAAGLVISTIAAQQVVQHAALLLALLTISACVQEYRDTYKQGMQARKAPSTATKYKQNKTGTGVEGSASSASQRCNRRGAEVCYKPV